MLEARRYMIGQMQNIVYKEFLAEVLPEETYTKYSLDTTSQNSYYDANISSHISVEFSTAAFRFGHTLVASLMKIYRDLEEKEFVTEALDAHFFNTSLIRRGEEQLVLLFHSLARQRAHQIDPAITDAIRNKLFRYVNALSFWYTLRQNTKIFLFWEIVFPWNVNLNFSAKNWDLKRFFT